MDAPDLLAVRDVALGLGGAVARVLQPFRAAGRRAPGPAAKQDEAWLEIVGALRRRYGDVPLVQGGRSNGARVACRTAREAGAAACDRAGVPAAPRASRTSRAPHELRAAGVEVLVVNGDRDPFGIPDAADAAQVAVLPGERHDLAKDPAAAGAAAGPWLRRWSAGPRVVGRRPAGAGRTTA